MGAVATPSTTSAEYSASTLITMGESVHKAAGRQIWVLEMKNSKAAAVSNAARDVDADAVSLRESLRNAKDATGKPVALVLSIPDRDETLPELLSRLRMLSKMLEGAHQSLTLIANSQLDKIAACLSEVRAAIQLLIAAVTDTRGITAFDPGTLVVTYADNGTTNLGPTLQQLYDRIEDILAAGGPALANKSKQSETFGSLSHELATLTKDISAGYDKLGASIASQQEMLTKVQALQNDVSSKGAELARLAEQAQTDRKNIQEYTNEVGICSNGQAGRAGREGGRGRGQRLQGHL